MWRRHHSGARGRGALRLLAGLLAVPVIACWASCASCATMRGGGACAPKGTVYLPSGQTLCVEVADTPDKLARGYMFRKEVPRGEGMVFLMGSTDIHPFWMKNCFVSLDIIWMDEGWKIVHIEELVPPCRKDPCPSYSPMARSRYVLEVGAGESRYLGLGLGDVLRFEPP